jgi:diguanylate cyclase (GGDEF)-like protein
LNIKDLFWGIQSTVQSLASVFTSNLGLALANLKLRDRLRAQSMRDSLTSLFDRRFMEEFTEQELHCSKRYDTPVSLIMLDVDHFKRFNDTHGHDAGDLVLKELVEHLIKHCRESDVVCRYGGEEFVIILPICPLNIAVTVAQKLCNGVREQIRILYRDEMLSITISMGIAASPVYGSSLETMLKAADQALYEAKRGGR